MQQGGEHAGTATVAGPLVPIAPGRPGDEVQCPGCGWCSRWHLVDDDAATVAGPTCPRCATTWRVDPAAPAPDVVVDAAGPNISPSPADRDGT